MLCPNCHGTRYATVRGQRVPCPECGGMGEIHCCDGLQEQIDPAADVTGGGGEPRCPPDPIR